MLWFPILYIWLELWHVALSYNTILTSGILAWVNSKTNLLHKTEILQKRGIRTLHTQKSITAIQILSSSGLVFLNYPTCISRRLYYLCMTILVTNYIGHFRIYITSIVIFMVHMKPDKLHCFLFTGQNPDLWTNSRSFIFPPYGTSGLPS